MTPQEIFDKAYLGIMKQGKQASDADGKCCYRTPDGLACAVGQLIDEKTAELWDVQYHSGIADIVSNLDDVPDWVKDNLTLLSDIQISHDNMKSHPDFPFRPTWASLMLGVAMKHDLTIPQSEYLK